MVPFLVWVIERIAHNHFYISLDILWIFTFVGWLMYGFYYMIAFYLEWETKQLLIRAVDMLRQRTTEEVDRALRAGNLEKAFAADVLTRRHLFLRILLQIMKLQSAFYAALFTLSFWRADLRLQKNMFESSWVGTLWVVVTIFPILTNFIFVQPMLMQNWSVFQSVFTMRPNMLMDTIRLTHENHRYRNKIAHMIVRYIECGMARQLMKEQGLSESEVKKKSDAELIAWLKAEYHRDPNRTHSQAPHHWTEQEALDYLYPVFRAKDMDGGGLLDMDEVNEMLVGLIGFKLLPRDIEAMERVLDPERSGITFEKFRLNLVCAELLNAEDQEYEEKHVQACATEHGRRQGLKPWYDKMTAE